MLARRSVWCLLAVLTLAGGGCGDDQLGGHTATEEEGLFFQANVAWGEGKNEEAIDLLQQSIETKPEPYSYFLRAKILESVGRDDEAIKDCEAGLKLPKEVDTDQRPVRMTTWSGCWQNARNPRDSGSKGRTPPRRVDENDDASSQT